MTAKNFDLSNVTVVFGAINISASDYSDDTGVSIVHDNDDWNYKSGVGGGDTRSKSMDKSATIEISLMQSAAANIELTAHRTLDINTPGGIGGVPLLVKDNNGTSLYTAETAWIEKAPDVEFTNEATARVWKIRCDELIAVHGGNS